ncbi:MAG TPA: HPr(Ser) kinase/phosphatase [Polyangia bacterium]|jgi:HPr kinase/phosphorylase|nr:HPr(Ser) kinase/phosphatase [Polyangia bacterium]
MTPMLTVRSLLDESSGLRLVLLAGEAGLARRISNQRIQKPGLALAGYVKQVHPERVQILGSTEISYLQTLTEEEARHSVDSFMSLDPACIVVTKGLDVPPALLESAERMGVPLLRTPIVSSTAIDAIQKHLELQLAPTASIHAVLMDVLGVGVLLLGKSGIGKSEAALDLIMRGHRLVADDLVEVRRTSGEVLVGWASELIKHHMEVRGLGIINIKDMFGVAAVRDEKKIELVLELTRWDASESHDRLGLDEMVYPILEVPVPLLRIPVSPGRNVSSLIEVAARNRLLQVRGHHSAREFQERLDRALADARERRWRDDVE